MRTTLNLDPTVHRQLAARAKREGRTLGEVASELLAVALDDSQRESGTAPKLRWASKPMRAKVDLEDKDEVYRALDG